MVMDKALIETRATVIWWFATLFGQELSKEQFAALSGEEGQHLFDYLAQFDDLAPEVVKLKHSLTKLNKNELPHLECAVEFSQIFLSDFKTGAPPYASVYCSKDGLMFQEPHTHMTNLLQSKGLSVEQGFKEPADHLAIELDYLGNLVIASLNQPIDAHMVDEQQTFIDDVLLSWLPSFANKISNQSNDSGFYSAASRLLLNYLQIESSWLATEEVA